METIARQMGTGDARTLRGFGHMEADCEVRVEECMMRHRLRMFCWSSDQ